MHPQNLPRAFVDSQKIIIFHTFHEIFMSISMNFTLLLLLMANLDYFQTYLRLIYCLIQLFSENKSCLDEGWSEKKDERDRVCEESFFADATSKFRKLAVTAMTQLRTRFRDDRSFQFLNLKYGSRKK
jgi:hypothetical protein